MKFVEEKIQAVVADNFHFFAARSESDPQGVLEQVEGELITPYVRFGNDWTGRGIVGDGMQEAAIAALETVRAECLLRLRKGAT